MLKDYFANLGNSPGRMKEKQIEKEKENENARHPLSRMSLLSPHLTYINPYIIGFIR